MECRCAGYLRPTATSPHRGKDCANIDQVAKALARKAGTRLQPTGAYAANLMGLSEQVPAKVVFLTDGKSKRVRVGNLEISLKQTSPRNMITAGKISGLVIQALRYFGRAHVSEETIKRLERLLSADDKNQLMKDITYAPGWIRDLIRRLGSKEGLRHGRICTRESGYIRRSVKIEMGARADHWPCEMKPITPYVAEQFPQGFKTGMLGKSVGCRTNLLGKATILHAEHHRPSNKLTPERLSRHYYDFDAMIRKGVMGRAIAEPELLARVAKHKSIFFRSGWAKYWEAAPGTLAIVPPEHRIKALHEDYVRMQEMFFGETPEFDAILGNLSIWEKSFNRGER